MFKQSSRALNTQGANLVALLTIGSTLMVAASILRGSLVGTVMVDVHALSGTRALFIYCLFCCGLALYSWAFYKTWYQDLDERTIRGISYLLAGIFSFMLPMLSNDVFSLLAYGDLANHGTDIFSQSRLNGNSFFLQYCNPNGSAGPNVYGPVCIAFMRVAAFFFPNSVLGALLAFKLITFIWAALFIGAAIKISGLIECGTRSFLFIVLNPLFLIEGVGQQHVDLLAAALALWTVYFVLSNKAEFAFVPIALAIGVKMSYVLLLPYAFLALYIQYPHLSRFLVKSLIGLLISGLTLILIYWPYFSSFNNLIVPFQSLYHQVPTKSIVEVFGDIIFYATQLLHPGNGTNLSGSMTNDALLAEQKQYIYDTLIVICRFVAIATSAFLMFRFFQKREEKLRLPLLYLRLLLLFLLFYSHVIYPWYLLLALPFAWFERDKRFMLWLFVLTCFCNAQGIMCSIDRSSWVYSLVVPLIAINVFIFLWRFRANFINKIP